MQFLKDNKMYIGAILLFAAGLWLYMTYFSGSSSKDLLTSDSTNSPLSQDVLVTLSNLNTIKLDGSIFSDPVFTSLNDFGVVIPAQNIGRRNPFAPL